MNKNLVINTKNSDIELSFLFAIGGLETENENNIFNHISRVAIDINNNIYILDSPQCKIQVFDQKGNYCQTIGGKGSGPGEFLSPILLSIDKKNQLSVFDMTKKNVQVFNINEKTSKLVKAYKINDNLVNNLENLNNGEVVLGTSSYELDDANITSKGRLSIRDFGYNIKKIFFKYEPLNGVSAKNLQGFDFFFLNQCQIAVDSFDNIFVSSWHSNEYWKFDKNGNLLKSFFSNCVYKIEHRKLDEQFNFDENIIAIDYKNRLWAQRNTEFFSSEKLDERLEKTLKAIRTKDNLNIKRDLKKQFEIYNNDGVLIAIADPFKDKEYLLLDVCKDFLFLKDEDHITLYVYKIIDKK